MRDGTSYLVAFCCSALGMFVGQSLGRARPGERAETIERAGVLSAPSFELVDPGGRRQILMASSAEGSPAIWFFDRNGKARLNLGLYGDDNAFIVLNDDQERAVEILRTVGPGSAPHLIMKSEGRDRIVMGLDGPDQDPFLVYYDPSGEMRTVFGRYRR